MSPVVRLFEVFIFKWSKKIGYLNQQNAENKLVCKMGINKQYMFITERRLRKGISLKQNSFLFSCIFQIWTNCSSYRFNRSKTTDIIRKSHCIGFGLCWLLKIKQLSFSFSIPYYILNTLKYLVKGSQSKYFNSKVILMGLLSYEFTKITKERRKNS